MNAIPLVRSSLLVSTAVAMTMLVPAQASAQARSQPEGAVETGGLEEIVVTAQKREQSLQDVPIAVTAVTQENLQANRIFTVNDLSAIAPGLTVKPSAGGISTPSFTMRGQVSFGVVAGSDKQVSVYVDGVYISSPRGSIFELPDIQRLEVLRGPQGTLFGRNATAGAISVTTRDPTGDAHVKLQGTYGNLDQYRLQATVDTPQVGPFSAYFSYVRDYRRGEVRNSLGGLIWDRSLSPSPFGVQKSPRWLGSVDTNSYFAAVKFEPADNFKMIYKFDRNDDHGTPDATALVGYDPAAGGGLVGNILTALFTSQPVYLDPTAKRPKIVSNGWVTARDQRVQGHSLTATWQPADRVTVKNIMAYRKSTVFAPSAIDGISSLTFTQEALVPYSTLIAFSSIGLDPRIPDVPSAIANIPRIAGENANRVGQRFLLIASEATSISKQWSDELQVNYTSGDLQATAGALWFHSSDYAGGPLGMQNTFSLGAPFIPASGLIPLGNQGGYFNKATSMAAYAQLEYKITPVLELVAGARITKDKKTSSFLYDVISPITGQIEPRPRIVPPTYRKTKPNFLVGLNWKPNEQTLVYGKYSTSFVSGGSTAGVEYVPETASSVEFGVKSDLLDHRLRANLAIYHVIYNHFQSPQSTTGGPSTAILLNTLTPLYGAAVANELPAALSTFVIDQGKIRAEGAELELTAAPTRGLTLGGSLGYSHVKFTFINPIVLAANNNDLAVTARPKITASLYGSYETQPLWDDVRLMLRMDGQYRSKILLDPNQKTDLIPSYQAAKATDGFWLVNGRMALKGFKFGPVDAELALWGKNIFNRKDTIFSLPTPLTMSANFVTARTFGADLTVEF